MKDENPFIKARAVWLLAELGESGRKEVEKQLKNPDEKLRATAFRALRQKLQDIIPYAKQLSNDASAFVRREFAVSLRDLPHDDKKDILPSLAKQYDGKDRWYLETLGAAMDGEDTEKTYWYDTLKALLDAIMNPGAAIAFGYESWLINMKDGESVYGFIISENKKNVVLKDITGQKHSIPVNLISIKQKQSKSLMPDPVANSLTAIDLVNVVEFLLVQSP